MKTSSERIDDTTVKLTVEVEPERVKKAFDEAARHLAAGVTIPGFRKGKVPRRVLEARIGEEAIRGHAIEDHLSSFYAEAVQAEELSVVASPEMYLKSFDEKEGAQFEATVAVRPEFEAPDHTGITVTFPEWEVGDDEVDEQIDDLRERFAELDEVERPAAVGDYVTIDLETTTEDGERLESGSAEDAMYEVGSGGVTPELDEQLQGAVAGAVLEYDDQLPDDFPEHPGETVHFTVTVKDVRAKTLPELDDDFARSASEFETLEELREDIRSSLQRRKVLNAQQDLRARVLEAYLALVDIPLPEKMIESEKESRLGDLRRQAERYGLELEQLLEMQGTSMEEVVDDLDPQVRQSVKAQIVLEQLAKQVDIEVESADLEREIHRHAQQQGVEPGVIARVINEQGSIGVLVGDVIRRKALDLLVEEADIQGAPSDEQLAELQAQAAAPPTGPTAGGATVDVDAGDIAGGIEVEPSADEDEEPADTASDATAGPESADEAEDEDGGPDGSSEEE